MAAIGTGWVDGAWVEAGWVTEAWSDVVGNPILDLCGPLYSAFLGPDRTSTLEDPTRTSTVLGPDRASALECG